MRLHISVAAATSRRFTRGAAQLELAQTTIIETVRKLEEDLRVRLLARSMQSIVSGVKVWLLRTIARQAMAIEIALDKLTELHRKPAGHPRITAGEHDRVRSQL